MIGNKNIKYLISLSPGDRLVAGMMFLIIFFAFGWIYTSYKYSRYRTVKENQIIDIMDRQQKWYDSAVRYIITNAAKK